MMDGDWEILVRLITAAVFGAIIGLNRELHRKPAGLRTHALVSLGAATAVWFTHQMSHGDAAAASRVMQGLVAGIGFLGAGVIMHHDADSRVEGLTTAASIWVAAMLGVGCGGGLIRESGFALMIAMVLLVGGGDMENFFASVLNRGASRGSTEASEED